MKLLYFSRDYTTHDHRFLTKLAESEHTIYYLRLERQNLQLEDRPLPPQVEIIPWGGGQAPAKLADVPRRVFELKSILQQLKPSLVHAGPIQRSAFLAAIAGARPLVSMSWGYDLLQDAQTNAAWRWATRFTLKRSAAFVGDCDTIRKLAIAHGMAPNRIVTFPWGVDLEHFSPTGRAETPTGVFTLLSTRGWESIYGIETIARAFVEVARIRPNVRLVLLGSGSQSSRVRQILSPVEHFYEAESEDQPSLPRVQFLGQVGYAGLPRIYRSADLYWSASRSDGSSISLLEAMACGCPVLVSDIPGNREWVTPGENGWLCPPGDVSAFAQVILDALDNRDHLAEMGRRARGIAEERADWDKNFPQLFQAYQIALKSL